MTQSQPRRRGFERHSETDDSSTREAGRRLQKKPVLIYFSVPSSSQRSPFHRNGKRTSTRSEQSRKMMVFIGAVLCCSQPRSHHIGATTTEKGTTGHLFFQRTTTYFIMLRANPSLTKLRLSVLAHRLAQTDSRSASRFSPGSGRECAFAP